MDNQPLHIAIIPDGNRRWAKSKMMMPWKGHEKSAENFQDIIKWCASDERIDVLTIWCLSTENWKRDSSEIDKLFILLSKYLNKERETFKNNNIKLLHSGRRDRMPQDLVNLLDDICNETKNNESFTLHLAIDYGGKDEILRAFSKLITKKRKNELDNEDLRPYLDQPNLPDIDLIIRTSGEMRTSNFFLWQSVYAEWIFTETLFPDFTEVELEKCIDDYSDRKRRFGS